MTLDCLHAVISNLALSLDEMSVLPRNFVLFWSAIASINGEFCSYVRISQLPLRSQLGTN